MAGEGKFIDNLMNGNVVVPGTITAENTGADIVDLTVATTLTPAQSGKTFTLGTAGGFTVTLPRPVAGLKYQFIVKVAPTTSYIIATAGSANIIHGCIISGDLNAANDTGATAASDTITFVANKAIIGNSVDLISDGTNWYAKGYTTPFDGITFTQAT
jgi:hypothetical protein